MVDDPREYPTRPLVGIGIVLLRRETSEVLLICRGRPPAMGEWSLPGGAQKLGETAEAAARRELQEETGLQIDRLQLAAHVDSIHRDKQGRVQYHYTILDFCGSWQGGEPVAGGDAQAVKWIKTDDLDDAGLRPETRSVITRAGSLLS